MDIITSKSPYILYMTPDEEGRLRKWITTNQLDIKILLRVPPDKRKHLSELMEMEIREADNEPQDGGIDTEPGTEVIDKKPLLIDNILFKEMSLTEHINLVRKQLTQTADGMSVREQNNVGKESKDKSLDENKDELSRKSEKEKTSAKRKIKPVETTAGIDDDFDENQMEEPETSGIKRKLDGTLALDSDSSTENTQESDLNVAYSEKENDAVEIYIDMEGNESGSENGSLNYNEIQADNLEEKKQSKIIKGIQNEKRRVMSKKKGKKRVRRRSFDPKLKSFSERWSSLRCDFCKRSFASEFFFNRHMQHVHPTGTYEKKVGQKKPGTNILQVCDICKKQFADKYSLGTHIKNIHGESRVTFQCDLCGAVLKSKGSLGQHMRAVHANSRPHMCKICGKHFKVPQQLRSHERTHDPNYIETCSHCGKTVRKGQLSIHMRRHGDDKKHMCDTCGRRFFDKNDCIRHQRIHTGEKPYKCNLCSYTCANKGNLTSHLASKHRDNDNFIEATPPQKNYRIKRKKLDNGQSYDNTVFIVAKSGPAYSISQANSSNEVRNLPEVLTVTNKTIEIIEADPSNETGTQYVTIINNGTENGVHLNTNVDQPNDGVTVSYYTEQTSQAELKQEDNIIISNQSTDGTVYHDLRPVFHQNDVVQHGSVVGQEIISTTQNDDHVVTIISYDSSGVQS